MTSSPTLGQKRGASKWVRNDAEVCGIWAELQANVNSAQVAAGHPKKRARDRGRESEADRRQQRPEPGKLREQELCSSPSSSRLLVSLPILRLCQA